MFKNCEYQFYQKYEQGNYIFAPSLATELGSILHKGLELKGRYIINKQKVDYDEIKRVVMDGAEEVTDKGTEKLIGVKEIKRKYFEEWNRVDEKSGMTYEQKLDIYFNKVLPTRMEDEEWEVIGVEIPFKFVYDGRVIIHGFIDRIDRNRRTGEYRVVDYKSSKKVFIDKEIKTPLQMVVYDLACLYLYGALPTKHEYDFICLNKKQTEEQGVCSQGYLKRGVKKINSLLDAVEKKIFEDDFVPSPSPLCHWCDFCKHSVGGNSYSKSLCEYYSLWTPENKTYAVNKKFGEVVKNQRIFSSDLGKLRF